jgi:uncharacterized protein (TIGR00297 family)
MSGLEGQGTWSLLAALQSRLLPGLGVNLALALAAWRAGTIRPSGVVAGLLVGTVIWLGGGWRWFLVLFAFFALGSALTKLGYSRKAARGLAEADRGRRGWQNAFANAGVGAVCALLWLLFGVGGLAAAFVASFATALFDTAGSEIGGLYGKTPISLRSFRRVPPGTEGAVSLEGTLGAFVASALLVGVAVLAGTVGAAAAVPVLLAAVLGGLYESLAAGKLPLGHTALNFTNTLVGAVLAWVFSRILSGQL